MFRVKVHGPSVTQAFGVDIFVVDSPTDVLDRNGVLIVTTGPRPEVPNPYDPERMRPALRSTQHVYPRGGWTRVVIEDVVE
jgi:hypothetical protein